MSSRVEIEVTAEDLNATSTLSSVDDALKKQGDTLDKTAQQTKNSATETSKISEEMGKFTDKTFLATEGINNLRGGLLGAGFGVITGVAIAAATAFFEWAFNTKDLNEQLKLASDNFLNLTKTINGSLAASNEFRAAEDKLIRAEQALARVQSARALIEAESNLVRLETVGILNQIGSALLFMTDAAFDADQQMSEAFKARDIIKRTQEVEQLKARIELLRIVLESTNPEFIKNAEMLAQWQGPLRATADELAAIEAQSAGTFSALVRQFSNVLDTRRRLDDLLSGKEKDGLQQVLLGFNIQFRAQQQFLAEQGIVSQEAKDAEIGRVSDFNRLLMGMERDAEQGRKTIAEESAAFEAAGRAVGSEQERNRLQNLIDLDQRIAKEKLTLNRETLAELEAMNSEAANRKIDQLVREKEAWQSLAGSIGASSIIQAENGEITEQASQRIMAQAKALQISSALQSAANSGLNQWILGQSKLGPALKAATAQALASVAARAAVEALYMTGVGLVALTPWGAGVYGPAPPWFAGAAKMAGVAAVAGVAARGLAGGNGGTAGPAGSALNPISTRPGFDPNRDQQNGLTINVTIERLEAFDAASMTDRLEDIGENLATIVADNMGAGGSSGAYTLVVERN